QQAWMMVWRCVSATEPLTVLSVGATTVPDEKPGVVCAVPVPTEVLLVAIHDSSDAMCAGTDAEPAEDARLRVVTYSKSRLISGMRLESWYSISESRPYLSTASCVPAT